MSFVNYLWVYPITEELQWLEHLWNNEICSNQGYFELISVNRSARPEASLKYLFDILLHEGILLFSLSNEYTQHTIFNI